MKFSLSIILSLLIIKQHGNVVGEYFNYFGSNLKINSDSTFIYNWKFDLTSSWSKGKWKINNDTIYFRIIPIFDTLRNEKMKDTLILSIDEKPELITDNNNSIIQFISSGSQNLQKMSTKLYIDGENLIEIMDNGKLVTEKQKVFWDDKWYNTWFVKKK